MENGAVCGMNLAKAVCMLAVPVLLLAGCGTAAEEVEGEPDQAVHTALFDFTVSDITAVDSYNSFTPRDGYQLVQTKLSITNTSAGALTMYAGVFEARWDGGHTTCLTAVDEDMVPDSYILYPQATYRGVMIFEVPADVSTLTIAYEDTLSDEDGNIVYLIDADW